MYYKGICLTIMVSKGLYTTMKTYTGQFLDPITPYLRKPDRGTDLPDLGSPRSLHDMVVCDSVHTDIAIIDSVK